MLSLLIPVISVMAIEIIRPVIISFALKYDIYINYFYSQYDRGLPSYSLLTISLIAYIAVLYLKYTNKNDLRINILFNLQLICLVLASWVSILPNGSRIVYMFIPVQCVILPNAIRQIRERHCRAFIGIVSLTLYSAFFINYYYVKNFGSTFPYQFIYFN